MANTKYWRERAQKVLQQRGMDWRYFPRTIEELMDYNLDPQELVQANKMALEMEKLWQSGDVDGAHALWEAALALYPHFPDWFFNYHGFY